MVKVEGGRLNSYESLTSILLTPQPPKLTMQSVGEAINWHFKQFDCGSAQPVARRRLICVKENSSRPAMMAGLSQQTTRRDS